MPSYGAVGSDLQHAMVVSVRYDDAALAIHGNPRRFVELRSCVGAVSKPSTSGILSTSGPRERAHGAVGSELAHEIVALPGWSAMMMLPSPSTATPQGQ